MINDDAILHLKNQLCFPLYVASRLTTKAYKPHLKELDITYPQYLVLLVLWQHKALTVSVISEKLFLKTNTVTPLLKRLEEKGIVERKRSDTDERVVEISLTSKGENLKLKALKVPNKIIESMVDGEINAAELQSLEQFKNQLDILVKNLKKKAH